MPFDENDVKIAGSHPSRSIARADNDALSANQVEKEHENISRAHLLGASLAESVIKAQDDLGIISEDDDAVDTRLQSRLLLCFAVATGLDKYCVSNIAARTALNGFYNSLKRLDSGFYDDLNSTGAFSFYYLAVRRHTDIERRIGQTFAMLCSKDGSSVYQELGEALYFTYMEQVRGEIDRYGLLKQ